MILKREITVRRRAQERGFVLRMNENQLRGLVQLLPAAVYVCDASGVITHYNQRSADLWGREPQCGDPCERICGAPRLFLPDGTPLPHENAPLAQVLRTGVSVENQELILERPDGSRVTVLVNPTPLWDELGEVCGAVNCMVDITERKRAEEALQTKEAQLAHISRSVRVVLYEAEPVEPFGARWVSENIELLSGFPAQQFLDAPTFWASRLHPQDRERVLQEFARLVNGDTLASEYRWQRADGVYRWFLDQAVVTYNRTGQSMAILGTWQDITDQKATREQLRQSLDQLRALSHRLEAIREDERSRVAREIHDELGGRLTCLRYDLIRFNGMESESAPSTGRISVGKKIESMIELVDQTIMVVQRVATDLRPQMLDELGLVAAIEWQTQEFGKRTGIATQCFSTAQDVRINRDRATALFRICQEALTNVARHAHATNVVVRVDKARDYIMLEVEDNGDGMAAELLMDVQTIGLAGMRERAVSFNGECRISASPGRGTKVTARIPIEDDLREDGDAYDDDEDEPHTILRQDGIGHNG